MPLTVIEIKAFTLYVPWSTVSRLACLAPSEMVYGTLLFIIAAVFAVTEEDTPLSDNDWRKLFLSCLGQSEEKIAHLAYNAVHNAKERTP